MNNINKDVLNDYQSLIGSKVYYVYKKDEDGSGYNSISVFTVSKILIELYDTINNGILVYFYDEHGVRYLYAPDKVCLTLEEAIKILNTNISKED